ncbi:DUF819 family protein [Runella aurantiaca]|uniref:DUF819 family protein n=1 Tax=Runella aurantiaca TaxID=2282308 RepID=A0A369ICR2_9BACT|nr:DUF819 family protein [Runella aurantiaca]RDB05283.1 DUF819 family protein [Runella aurantiaca]
MPLFQDSLPILAVLMVNIIISERLARLPYLRHMGTALIVIILTAITSNLGLIPASTNSPPIYDGIFTYLAPISIFYLLLTVNLKGLKKAGTPMIFSFFLGTAGTMLGVIAGIWAISGPKGFGEFYYALGGMFTGTYIGGSTNFNALALHYEVNKEGNVYAAAVAVDNILTALWMVATLLLPQFLNRYFPRRIEYNHTAEQAQQFEKEASAQVSDVETFNPQDLAILVGMGAAGLYVSKQLAALIPQVPQILILTTLALALAQLPVVQRLRGMKVLAMFFIYLFLAVIGAFCDIEALLKDGPLAISMMVFVSTLIVIHALVIFGIGALLKQDWDVLSIASQANIGGSASALALSKSLNRPDLYLPGILVGALGNAIGTYCGLFVAEYLKTVSW